MTLDSIPVSSTLAKFIVQGIADNLAKLRSEADSLIQQGERALKQLAESGTSSFVLNHQTPRDVYVTQGKLEAFQLMAWAFFEEPEDRAALQAIIANPGDKWKLAVREEVACP